MIASKTEQQVVLLHNQWFGCSFTSLNANSWKCRYWHSYKRWQLLRVIIFDVSIHFSYYSEHKLNNAFISTAIFTMLLFAFSVIWALYCIESNVIIGSIHSFIFRYSINSRELPCLPLRKKEAPIFWHRDFCWRPSSANILDEEQIFWLREKKVVVWWSKDLETAEPPKLK